LSCCILALSENLPWLSTIKSTRRKNTATKPKIIAVTKDDPQIKNKQIESKSVNAVVKIIPTVKTPSTTQLLEILKKEVIV